jgi:hypothetical protein
MNFYQRFIEGYSRITASLTDLTKKITLETNTSEYTIDAILLKKDPKDSKPQGKQLFT